MKVIRTVGRVLRETVGSPSGNYGHDWIIRRHLNWPRLIPLNVRIQHGWYANLAPTTSDLRVDQPMMLVWNARIAEEWDRLTGRPVRILGSPFVFFRRMERIEPAADARGTVVFPQHSTRNNETRHDVEAYCRDLDRLPDVYRPITICLHFHDWDQLEPLFRRYGYTDIVSAGKSRQPRAQFARNFYQILARHRYASSNDILTGTFYAIEMGIPFFIYGPESTTHMRSSGEAIDRLPFASTALELFRGPRTDITDAQRRFVTAELGLADAVPADQLRAELLDMFWHHEITTYPRRFVRKLKDEFHGE